MTNNTMRDGRDVPSSTVPATASTAREDAQHTPGPWRVGERHSGALIDVKARGLVVARVLVISADPAANPEQEAEANARLIASAPDLLAALKECRDGLAAAMRSLDSDGIERFLSELRDAGVADGVGVRASQAIAKAEGR